MNPNSAVFHPRSHAVSQGMFTGTYSAPNSHPNSPPGGTLEGVRHRVGSISHSEVDLAHQPRLRRHGSSSHPEAGDDPLDVACGESQGASQFYSHFYQILGYEEESPNPDISRMSDSALGKKTVADRLAAVSSPEQVHKAGSGGTA